MPSNNTTRTDTTTGAIPKTYDPQSVEAQWYQRWLDAGCFLAKPDPARQPHAIMIPPPNVTGVLHMGHLLNNTIQDILTRRARQDGKAALWLPGTDHAGIATQARVEKELRQQGKTRHGLGREQFIATAAQWRDKHGGIILEQLKKLGASCDWSRKVHTLDPGYSRAVLQAFVTLYERGHIHRGKRMVNWCPVSRTGLSDEEVIMKPRQGTFYRMRYELVEHPGQFIEIGTTRPETIPGDTAIAVHPDDPRHTRLIGKHAWRPFPRAPIPIIADKHVEKDFGSGILKVTPAHDKADFEIAQRHNLPLLDVMNPDATMNALAGEGLAGLDRFKARTLAVEKLRALGLLLKEEPYENNIGYSERADVPIEPRLSEQWFLHYPKVEEAKRAITGGFIHFHPDRWSKVYLHWLNNIQDWCISRQLWWGHRIPVWYRKGADKDEPSNRHVSLTPPADPDNWEQDPDVLDTWASSWLWCLATLGWEKPGDAPPDLRYWYPTAALATGPDIIFLWVARMIIAGLEFYGGPKATLTDADIRARIPFRHVYFNGIIRDAQGRKMSKSLGNSPDPLDLIAKFGADGLRLGLLSIAPKGQDILFSEERIVQGRNFCNKLWNAARYRQMSGPAPAQNPATPATLAAQIIPGQTDPDDHAILSTLATATTTLASALENYDFNTYTTTLYQFFWTDYCDWYLEAAKPRIQDSGTRGTVLAIQDICLRQFLLLLHPLAPFITEELFHKLGYIPGSGFIQDIRVETGPELLAILATHARLTPDPRSLATTTLLREFVTQARALKAQHNQATRKDLVLHLAAKDATARALASAHADKLKRLIGAAHIHLGDPGPADGSPGTHPATPTALGILSLELGGHVDAAIEKNRLGRELERLGNLVQAGEAKLNNPAFLAKAPPSILEGARQQLDATRGKRDEVRRLLAAYE
jgi:valyl-tRNA synthetase